MYSECIQSVFRVCSECVQSLFRVCSECVQSVFRICSEYVHIFVVVKIVVIASSSASSVSVFGIFHWNFQKHSRDRKRQLMHPS